MTTRYLTIKKLRNIPYAAKELINLYLVDTMEDHMLQSKWFGQIFDYQPCDLSDDRILKIQAASKTIYELGLELRRNMIEKLKKNSIDNLMDMVLDNTFKPNDELIAQDMTFHKMVEETYIVYNLGIKQNITWCNDMAKYVYFFYQAYEYPCCEGCIKTIYNRIDSLRNNTNRFDTLCNVHSLGCDVCRDWRDSDLKKSHFKYGGFDVMACDKCINGFENPQWFSYLYVPLSSDEKNVDKLTRIKNQAAKKRVKFTMHQIYKFLCA